MSKIIPSGLEKLKEAADVRKKKKSTEYSQTLEIIDGELASSDTPQICYGFMTPAAHPSSVHGS